MKRNKKAAIAISLAAIMACGVLAGCDLTSIDSAKNMKQVIAEIDITKSEDFQEGGEYALYKDVLKPTTVLKRDLIAEYITSGYNFQQSYGMSYVDVFNTLVDSLVNRQIYLQYSIVYFLKEGSYDKDGKQTTYELSDYKALLAEKPDDEIAALAFFLDEDERGVLEYKLRKSFNSSLDSQETSFIKEEDDDHDHDRDSRTLPTGVDTENDEYYPEKNGGTYKVYTGLNHESECGEYEAQDGSKPTTRKRAYGNFLSNLRSNYLLENGEDTTDIEKLAYYQLERKIAYETALIGKLNETFEAKSEIDLRDDDYKYVKDTLKHTYAAQEASYSGDTEAFETALDKMAKDYFLFYAPNKDYGFVINILLPFSAASSQALKDSDGDYGDKNGNKFQRRAALLEKLTATDQRGAWFTGHEDYSFKVENTTDGYKADEREYLFFEDSLSTLEGKNLTGETGTKYDAIKNYYGRYTYNGKVEVVEEAEDGHKHYKLTPTKIGIDKFIEELEGYLVHAGLFIAEEHPEIDWRGKSGYYKQAISDYYEDDSQTTVDYSAFLYYQNKVDFKADFKPSEIFHAGSKENTAMSVINELSFAYNTDTAGLNTYLGYAVSPYQTNFVKEFEYAAQQAVKGGAGTYTVAPSDYGWHIMYCTFSFADGPEDQPFYTFDADDVEKEGTFSYQYFEALKSSSAQTYAEVVSSKAITAFISCATIYEKRYKDLTELDKQ